MKRLIALVVALAMVGGALYLRGRWDDGENGNGDGEPVSQPERPTRLVCARELADLCGPVAGAEVTVEDVSTTFDRLTERAVPDLDAWLVFGPWPEMVDVERKQATFEPLFAGATRALGRSRLAAVGPDDLGPCDWRCLGDRANAEELRLGLPEPTEGLGLLIIGAASAGYFGGPDFATNDFTPEFEDWLSTLVAGATVASSPVERILQSRAFFDVALSTESEAEPLLEEASPDRKQGLALLYPGPVASVDVVLAGGDDALGDRLAEPLPEAGWSPPDEAPTGLPSAGVLLALRDQL